MALRYPTFGLGCYLSGSTMTFTLWSHVPKAFPSQYLGTMWAQCSSILVRHENLGRLWLKGSLPAWLNLCLFLPSPPSFSLYFTEGTPTQHPPAYPAFCGLVLVLLHSHLYIPGSLVCVNLLQILCSTLSEKQTDVQKDLSTCSSD